MDQFEQMKESAISKVDKSKKGSIDYGVANLCNYINGLTDYFTTSSCSGRIVVMTINENGKKDTSEWLIASHKEVNQKEVLDVLNKISDNQTWVRFEPFIIHIACRTIDDAKKLIQVAKECGLKRSGIVSMDKKILVEIIGSSRLDTIIGKNGEKLCSDSYIKELVNMSNVMMKKNIETIEKFFRMLKERTQ